MERDDPEGSEAGEPSEELDSFRGEAGEKYPGERDEPKELGERDEQSSELEKFRDEAAEKYSDGGEPV